MRRNVGAIVWGAVLIVAGILFLLQQAGVFMFAWDQVWPLFLVAAGVAFLVGFALSRGRDAGTIFVGTLLIGSGLFLVWFTYGRLSWGAMSDLWGWWPIIVGIAFLTLWLARRAADWSAAFWGVVLIGAGVIALFRVGDLSRYWPVVVIVAGLFLLIQAFARRR